MPDIHYKLLSDSRHECVRTARMELAGFEIAITYNESLDHIGMSIRNPKSIYAPSAMRMPDGTISMSYDRVTLFERSLPEFEAEYAEAKKLLGEYKPALDAIARRLRAKAPLDDLDTNDTDKEEEDMAENTEIQATPEAMHETTPEAAPDTKDDFVLTPENYYSDEANKRYLSNSLFKAAYGHPAHPHPCEAAAIFGPKLESEALLVGSYVDAFFEGPEAFEKFKEENKDKIMQKSGKAPYKFITDADAAIARASRDAVFMEYMGGDHQATMVGTIADHDFKIKMDAYHPGRMIVDLKYVKSSAEEYIEALKKRGTFIESYGYFIQGAIYQEIVFQNTGLRLPFFIAYITKEAIPDFGVVEVPQELLDDALEFVRLNLVAKPFALLRANPRRCNRRSCPYCRDLKQLAGPISYEDFERYSAS